MKEGMPLERVDPVHVRRNGRLWLDFGGCDYLRLAHSPALRQALVRAIQTHGWNVAASRLTTGNHPLYERAERKLARFFGAEAALLMPTGYTAPLAVAQALAGMFTLALVDEEAHVCLQDAAVFLGCPVRVFPHRDVDAVARWVRRLGPGARLILITDGLFGWNGAVAPLAEYRRVLPRNSWLLVDDAHAAGLLGRRGRGSVEEAGISRERLVQTLTLSKALGLYGGVVLCSREIRRRVVERSGCFGGGTPLSPALAAAVETALVELRRALPGRRRVLQEAARLRARLRAAGWEVLETPAPIVALFPADRREARRVIRALESEGIHPPWTEYPGRSAGYFRFMLAPAHTAEHLERLRRALLSVRGAQGRPDAAGRRARAG
ncbi:aminotransferase class I/II-fold pyridoxal phosphate-dependent enzyme [Limisphaera sp. 4302-co]|uniref:aminotransferase class I/II-fold pyridoxal phosphate-dependent enzyme n=1 Tax=Limisphaera sp. 4302-co TaxID=3400417 RepID=UPI003C1B577F